ncbi:MAG: hypothetical protein RBT69_05255 [Spirochaetia bacterium]|jgi:hypothetical protein|nr:hypothetical protein [Spirochaetia bacterium]
MLFIRRTARNVFIRSDQIDSLSEYLVDNYNSEIVTFEEGWEEVEEFQTLLFLTPPGLTKTRTKDAEKILKVPIESSRILSELFIPEIKDKITMVQLGPGIIIVRVVGDGSSLEKSLKEEHNAQSMSLEQGICEGEADDTILLLTNTPLTMTISAKDLIRLPLLIREPSHSFYRKLRKEGAHLITQSLKDKQWYEMRINIYDSKNHYNIHYERLKVVISDLDTGIVLGESWTRDHALMLMSVLAYQIHMFSLEPPEKIKRILMGLEYNSSNKRFVDMDLYYRNRKISKNDKNVRKTKEESRMEIREELYKSLSNNALEQLRQLEYPLDRQSQQ